MITDKETNYVYFSSLIKERKYNAFWERFEPLLIEHKINYNFIYKTRDIWCRDYMPVQVSRNKFIQFKYFPSYYLTPETVSKLTIPEELEWEYKRTFNIKKSVLVVDGGNVIKSRNQVILTEKVISENINREMQTVYNILMKDLEVEDVFFISVAPYDIIGHADGMAQFLDDRTLLVGDYTKDSKSWRITMDRALSKINLDVRAFPYVETIILNKDGDASAHGVYINYLRIGDIVFFPQFGIDADKKALREAENIFKDSLVVPVNCVEISMDGGVLNCISWNVKV